MLPMSNPYDENPQSQPSDPNPYGQQPPPANPYGQPTDPYDPHARTTRPAGRQYGEQPPQYGAARAYGQPVRSRAPGAPPGHLDPGLRHHRHLLRHLRPHRLVSGQQGPPGDRRDGASYANESQINTGRMLGKVFTIIYIVFIVLTSSFTIILGSPSEPAKASADVIGPAGRAEALAGAVRRADRAPPAVARGAPRSGWSCRGPRPRSWRPWPTPSWRSAGGAVQFGGRGAPRRSPSGGPAVLLRGDMDALPVTEETGEPFAAPAGAMHACGHDLHTAGLVGAAKLLSRHRDQLAGDVVFMFQPGEEGCDGAGAMIAEGVLDAAGPRVSAAYGLHVFSSPCCRAASSPPGPGR